jgi:prepilin-type N-terminal cleavage/methylation domain-containing protein
VSKLKRYTCNHKQISKGHLVIFQRPVHTVSARGFTIVELLIVIVVIAILAAISIVAYNGIQNRANDSTVQSDLANIAKKLGIYKIDSTIEGYPLNTTQLGTIEGLTPSRSAYELGYTNFAYCVTTTTGTAYALVAKSKSGTAYYVSSAGKGTFTPAGPNSIVGQDACDRISLTAGAGGSAAVGYQPAGTPVGWQSWID